MLNISVHDIILKIINLILQPYVPGAKNEWTVGNASYNMIVSFLHVLTNGRTMRSTQWNVHRLASTSLHAINVVHVAQMEMMRQHHNSVSWMKLQADVGQNLSHTRLQKLQCISIIMVHFLVTIFLYDNANLFSSMYKMTFYLQARIQNKNIILER